MTIEIIGEADRNRLYCTASFTKMMTTFVCLSQLSQHHDLAVMLDDENFLDSICTTPDSRNFLLLFQKIIGSQFSVRDVCSFYNGLPYTFNITKSEIVSVEQGNPLKHHSIMDEKVFLDRCQHEITMMDPNHSKFHYSELAIIFIGYLIEKIYNVQIEVLYKKFVLDAFQLQDSLFSRVRPVRADYHDLSNKYDYPSIAILDHGYFCYSNGFFTTLNDQKKLIEYLLLNPVFQYMTDISKARAASPRLMNGMTVEIRKVGDDIIYGYEGLSYSGCNIWAYSTKLKKGYVATTDDEDAAYPMIYSRFGYEDFDIVPAHTQEIYQQFIKTSHYDFSDQPIPAEYIGKYHRVDINTYHLEIVFTVAKHHIIIRNPDEVKYDIVYDNGIYRTATKDRMHGIRVAFHTTEIGNRYMEFDGTLYQKISE